MLTHTYVTPAASTTRDAVDPEVAALAQAYFAIASQPSSAHFRMLERLRARLKADVRTAPGGEISRHG